MLRVSEGQGTRLPKTRPPQRSTLTTVLQFLGKSTISSKHSGEPQDPVDAAPVWCLFQSPVQQPTPLAPIAPRGCRRLPPAAFSLPSHMDHMACWENAATITTAGLSQTGAQVHTQTDFFRLNQLIYFHQVIMMCV